MKQTFKDYLWNKHFEERGHMVAKKDLPDDLDDWLCLDSDTWIKFAQEWGNQEVQKEQERHLEIIKKYV